MIAKLALVSVAAVAMALLGSVRAADWPMANGDIANSSGAPSGPSVDSIGKLVPSFILNTTGSNWSTPVVDGEGVYIDDSAGSLSRVDAVTGKTVWTHPMSYYDGVPKSAARMSVAVSAGVVVVGDRSGAHLIGIDAGTGNKLWITQLDIHPGAILTGSPIIVDGIAYLGVSSNDGSQFLKDRTYQSNFRGSLQAVDVHTGKAVWVFYTMPDDGGVKGGWSGGAMISTPAADPKRGALYFTTDHEYTMPKDAYSCLAAARNDWDPKCLPREARFDSVIALDLKTGAVKWSFFGAGADIWKTACGELLWPDYPFPTKQIGQGAAGVRICPPVTDYLDWSFAAGSPQVFSAKIDGNSRDLIGAAEKSGVYWALDADTGKIVWHTLIGPYSEPGGLGSGAAYDGTRLYLALTNLDLVPFRMASGETANGGSWAALDPATGKVLWQVADPQGAADYASPAVANGVVYVGSMAPKGDNMYGLDASTGKVVWSFASGGSVASHPAIAKGRVYCGSGFPLFGGADNTKFYAFADGL